MKEFLIVLPCGSNMFFVLSIGSWVRTTPLSILPWKMDSKRLKEAHAYALTRVKDLGVASYNI